MSLSRLMNKNKSDQEHYKKLKNNYLILIKYKLKYIKECKKLLLRKIN